jgi:hypothetical protein
MQKSDSEGKITSVNYPTTAQYSQEVAQCDANILQWTNGLNSDFAAWLDSQFTPLTSASATALKAALGYGAKGAKEQSIEDLSGAVGAAFGGIVGYVLGFSACPHGPDPRPRHQGSAEGIWSAVLYGITQQGLADCAGTSSPAYQLGN